MVYIEYVIIDNVVITYLLLRVLAHIMRFNVLKRRFALAVFLGVASAVAMPFYALSSIWIEMAVKLAVAVSMLLIFVNHGSFKRFLLALIAFLGMTFMFGGACIMFTYMFDINIQNGVSEIPFGVFLLVAYMAYLIAKIVYGQTKRRKTVSDFLYNAKLFLQGRTIEISAFLDSGNRLYDNDSPVVIITARALFSQFERGKIFDILTKGSKRSGFKNCHYINYAGVSGLQTKMVVFEAEKLLIYCGDKENIIDNITVGVSISPFKDVVGYDMLLHPEIM